jgi:signal transduction histidine kinase
LLAATVGACAAVGSAGFLGTPVAAVATIGQTAAFAIALLLQDKRRRRAEAQADAHAVELQRSYDHIRRVTARLVDAQDSERSRIGRELHDDIGQQLALLATNVRLSGDTEETVAQIAGIARRVREMSHRLHPALLQLVGLIASVHSLQREQSRGGAAIDFTHRDIPQQLQPALSLCLFRVIQEAVQNAITHGQARHIAIDLRRVDHDLMLTVADDGRGFDVQAGYGTGLGLISIIERTEIQGGKVVIRSTPGAGTRIEAQVPLPDGGHRMTTPASPCDGRSEHKPGGDASELPVEAQDRKDSELLLRRLRVGATIP